ncbi:TrmO family methyltransferase domain-containing protein [Salibaculum griseiflavum]|uniref:tRNA (N6-threonylcarbamoyladenosine(37)-N6)-methyltransferase TrmO n=1 Tax=Salibaculum griseiflavum TaxID=1914409 RepID=A0A2V1P7P2_9RHOB|nr:TrmO family methyltransferase [Salibaculum griseiflavum]PWG18521.1 tRNA (N6-threonylcarbamoyladenosine(37)-N6)-methyltransferase TrmO [Salibaculum griseiflavum]
MKTKPARDGEVALGFDPAECKDAAITFIGVLQSDWAPGEAPKNLRQSREAGGGHGRVVISAPYRDGLRGLQVGQAIWLVLWFDRARRDLIVQAPRHADGPRGTFALRSPVRPNPIAIEAVRITSLDHEAGEIGIDVTDAFDGTPVLDIKPWLDGIDIPPGPED